MLLIVGLGNPGKEYQHTRHNMGFDVVDLFAEKKLKEDISKPGFKGEYVKTTYKGEQVILLKPQTYMNLSGQSVLEIANFFKIDVEDIVVVYDDMDLVPGKIRLRPSGSFGGHKGIKSIIDNLKTDKIKRIRVGVGKAQYSVIDYVLEKPSKEDQELIIQALNKSVEALDDIIVNGFDHAMCYYN